MLISAVVDVELWSNRRNTRQFRVPVIMCSPTFCRLNGEYYKLDDAKMHEQSENHIYGENICVHEG